MAPLLLVHRLRVILKYIRVVVVLHRVLVVGRLRSLDHFLSLLSVHVHHLIVMVQVSLWLLSVPGRQRLFHPGAIAQVDAAVLRVLGRYTNLETRQLLTVRVAASSILLLKIHHCHVGGLGAAHTGPVGRSDGSRRALVARGGGLLGARLCFTALG